MKSLKLNAFFASMVRVLNILFPLITGPYILRTLSKDSISIFDSANTLAQLFIPLAGFGIYNYGIRNISKVKQNIDKRNILFSELFYLSIFSTLVASFIYYVYIFFTIDNEHQQLIYSILGLQILFQFLSIEWVNEAFENYSFILYKTIIIRVTMLVLVFTFIKSTDDVFAYAAIMTLSEILNILLSFIWIKKDIKLVKVKIKRILKLISPLFTIILLANINMLYTFLDRLFLSNSPNQIYISDYVVSQNIVMLISGILGGAVSVNVPRLSSYLGEKNHTAYQNLVHTGGQLFLFFMVPIAFGLIILGKEATHIYAGDQFLSAGIVTSIFAFRTIIWALDNILGIQILFVKGYERNLTLYVTIGGLCNFLLNYILFTNNLFSPAYYISTTILAETVVLFMYINFIRNNNILNIVPIFKNLLKYSLVSILFFVITFSVDIFLPIQNTINTAYIISIFIKIVMCCSCYILVLYIFKDNIIFEIIKLINNKMRKAT